MPKLPTSSLEFPKMASLDLTKSAVDQIYAAMKRAILISDLFPGQAISENEIGHSFNASRTPVREALSRLREEGLVVTFPSRGTYVSKLSERQVKGAQFIREAIEVASVRMLCQQGISEPARKPIEDALAAQREAIEKGDKEAFRLHDDEFHLALASATGLQRVEPLLVREKAILDRLRVLAITDEKHMARLVSEHEAICAAIDERNDGAAVDWLRKHLRRVLGILENVYKAHEDYFE